MLPAGPYTVTFSSMGTAFQNLKGEHSVVATYDMRFATCFASADVNIDGSVNVDDLVSVILAWGACGSLETCLADINLDGTVDVDDLIAVILAWG